jgi:hypothetical protein
VKWTTSITAAAHSRCWRFSWVECAGDSEIEGHVFDVDGDSHPSLRLSSLQNPSHDISSCALDGCGQGRHVPHLSPTFCSAASGPALLDVELGGGFGEPAPVLQLVCPLGTETPS